MSVRGVDRAADVHRGRTLRIVLGAVDVRPGRRVQHEAGLEPRRRRLGDVPVGARERHDLVGGELLGQRVAELAACARDQDWSRSERIGVSVLHRCLTRGSDHGSPCSSGAAGSYSSVTW